MVKVQKSTRQLRLTVFLLAALFTVASLLTTVSTVEAAKDPVEVKWAVFVPRELHSMPPLIEWSKQIEEKTKGAVKVKMYFAGEIAETKDLVSLARKGSIDIISTPPVYYSSIFPLNGVLQAYYPLNKTVEQAVYTWRGLFRDIPELQEEFAQQNMFLINRSCLGLYEMISKKPVKNLSDVEGMKIRIIGGDYPSSMVKAAGAVPVFQSMQDVYEGFLRGVTDGILLDAPAIATMRLAEIGKYVGFKWGSVLGWSTSINMDTWNALSPEAQEAIKQTSVTWGEADLENMLANELKYTEQLKKQGVEFIDFDEKDYQTMVSKAGNPYEHCKQALLGLGVAEEVADRFVKRWKELNEEYEKEYLATGKKWQYQ